VGEKATTEKKADTRINSVADKRHMQEPVTKGKGKRISRKNEEGGGTIMEGEKGDLESFFAEKGGPDVGKGQEGPGKRRKKTREKRKKKVLLTAGSEKLASRGETPQ